MRQVLTEPPRRPGSRGRGHEQNKHKSLSSAGTLSWRTQTPGKVNDSITATGGRAPDSRAVGRSQRGRAGPSEETPGPRPRRLLELSALRSVLVAAALQSPDDRTSDRRNKTMLQAHHFLLTLQSHRPRIHRSHVSLDTGQGHRAKRMEPACWAKANGARCSKALKGGATAFRGPGARGAEARPRLTVRGGKHLQKGCPGARRHAPAVPTRAVRRGPGEERAGPGLLPELSQTKPSVHLTSTPSLRRLQKLGLIFMQNYSAHVMCSLSIKFF